MAIITDKLIGIDTNIFIYYFQQNDELGYSAKSLFELLVEGKIKAITSIITLIELLSLPASEKDIDILKAHFLETPNLTIQEINQTIGIEAARIRRVYGFRIPDAIQLATCLYHKTDLFITNDQRLKPFKELSIVFLNRNNKFQ